MLLPGVFVLRLFRHGDPLILGVFPWKQGGLFKVDLPKLQEKTSEQEKKTLNSPQPKGWTNLCIIRMYFFLGFRPLSPGNSKSASNKCVIKRIFARKSPMQTSQFKKNMQSLLKTQQLTYKSLIPPVCFHNPTPLSLPGKSPNKIPKKTCHQKKGQPRASTWIALNLPKKGTLMIFIPGQKRSHG